MPGLAAKVSILALLALVGVRAVAEEEGTVVAAVISVAEQRLVVLRDGMWTHKYRVSTSKFGLGDSFGSYKTPLGRHRVCDKVGEGLASGAVMKHRNATGEILPVNAPGRDPIVTRIIWLDGLEQRNANARSRGIYIHGTVEEEKIGDPVSYGCIRMRSRDVMELFDALPVGAEVMIQEEKLPRYKRWSAPAPELIAAKTAPKATPKPEKIMVEKTGPTVAVAHHESKPAAPELADEPAKIVAEPSTPHPTLSGHGALAALKGSILFSDLPKPGAKNESPLNTMRGPVLEPIAEAPPLPRVTLRAEPGLR
jgi:hypothetical protein